MLFAIGRAADTEPRRPEFDFRCGYQAIFDIVFSPRLSMTDAMLRRSMIVLL
jgi:hypothetical protein